MQIISLDHLVLTVQDIEKTAAFYQSVLGIQKVVFGSGRVALKFGAQKINLHQAGAEIDPKAAKPTPGSADLCFITDQPIKTAMEHVENSGVEILLGPVERTGANGPMTSFYFRDPDQNLIEVSSYNK